MDPLSVLRDYATRGAMDAVHLVDNTYHFGDDYRFPKSVETAYRSKQGGFYTLDALVFFVQHTHIKHTDYMNAARNAKLQFATFTDRKPLQDYLEGRVSSNDAIELLIPQQIPEDHVEENHRVKVAFPPSNDEIELIREREWPVRDRETILLCHNKSFRTQLLVLKKRPHVAAKALIPREVLAEEISVQPSQSFIADSSSAMKKHKVMMSKMVPDSELLMSKSKPDVGPPIIVVPSASQTLVNTFNVKEFLEDGVYVSPDVKIKAMAKKVDVVFVQRKMGRERPVAYEIRDKVSGLTSKDWERVVAVFVLGKEWQFKGWPFGDRVEIFNKFMGVFLRFEDDSVESAKQVMQWNVKIINLSKHRRHQDKTAVLNFWQSLDSHLQNRKLNLLY